MDGIKPIWPKVTRSEIAIPIRTHASHMWLKYSGMLRAATLGMRIRRSGLDKGSPGKASVSKH